MKTQKNSEDENKKDQSPRLPPVDGVQYYRPEEVCRFLGLHRTTLYERLALNARMQKDGSKRSVLGDGWIGVQIGGARAWRLRREP